MIDVQGQFSLYKLVERVRNLYDTQGLWEGAGEGNKQETEDKHQFIKAVLQNVYVFQCYTAVDFNLTVRSLAQFLKTHKNIGLIVIDGLHLIENVDMYSIKSAGSSSLQASSGNKPGPKKVGNNIMAMAN